MKTRLFPLTPLRQRRLEHALPLSEVARTAGLSLARASLVERDPSVAKAGELRALRTAVDRLAREAS